MRTFRIIGGMTVVALVAIAVLFVWSGLAANEMISKCHDNSAGEYIPELNARKAYCGEFGANTSDPLPRGY
ncbi:hypothetical protein MK632_14850 [Rhizobium changzhiense]|uniref:hypothetical protein n=1 Tax=Rhizobium changzhiense TaxID=2692317 RepID=UPI001F0BA195|nr:hypothetical protein [Rhizobium changzhiense]MCH4547046.1 hypothetical protein [Rhizobium changzhiense]